MTNILNLLIKNRVLKIITQNIINADKNINYITLELKKLLNTCNKLKINSGPKE